MSCLCTQKILGLVRFMVMCVYYHRGHYQYLDDGLPRIFLVCITKLRLADAQEWEQISVATN